MQGLLGHWAAASGVHVEEFTADVGQAGQLGGAVGEHGLVAGIVVHHQVTAPPMQERARVGAGAAGLVVEHDDRRTVVMDAGPIGPQVGVSRLGAAGIELAHWGFVGMHAIVLP